MGCPSWGGIGKYGPKKDGRAMAQREEEETSRDLQGYVIFKKRSCKPTSHF